MYIIYIIYICKSAIFKFIRNVNVTDISGKRLKYIFYFKSALTFTGVVYSRVYQIMFNLYRKPRTYSVNNNDFCKLLSFLILNHFDFILIYSLLQLNSSIPLFALKEGHGGQRAETTAASAKKKPGKKNRKRSKLFVIDKIMNHREMADGSFEYLVRWEGYESDDDTWEPIDSFENASNVLHHYYKKLYTNKQ